MPLSWNEIKHRAIAFAAEWRGETREAAERQSYWNDFFEVFGVRRRAVATFEEPVKKLAGSWGSIDLLWPGRVIVEHKSAGEDLGKAHAQAMAYIRGLQDTGRARDVPRFLIVSDFARIALHDLEPERDPDLPLLLRLPPSVEFDLADFHKHIRHFAFIAGYTQHRLDPEDPANIEATALMGELHDELAAGGYAGHDLRRFLVRILFCLFAEDTGIFPQKAFELYLRDSTAEDGSDLGAKLERLFRILDTPDDRRQHTLDASLRDFPYVNGLLFAERLEFADFNRAMRARLLACSAFRWETISPAVFGSLFQGIMEKRERRTLGAHYTAERNILKLIRDLFLDDLRAECDAAKRDKSGRGPSRLTALQKKLAALRFLDPACGCGNFLVIAYRELRALELDILAALHRGQQEMTLDEVNRLSLLNVDQFHGIEIEEFPARIAEVALWLADHQANVALGLCFTQNYIRLPLRQSPHIVVGNALRLAWREVLPPGECSYLLGNPPFVGKAFASAEQKADMARVCGQVKGAGVLDFVTAWYFKAAEYLTAAARTPAPAPGAASAAARAPEGRMDISRGLSAAIPPDTAQASDAPRRGAGTSRAPAGAHSIFSREPGVLPPANVQQPSGLPRAAFVSTNSISQGEQPGILWGELFARWRMKIHFAHRTFAWQSEARGKAHVHVVIIGFGPGDVPAKFITDYDAGDAHPARVQVANINPYLVEGNDVALANRSKPICDVSQIGIGNKPIDGGNFLFTEEERDSFLQIEPRAERWFRAWVGSHEFINGYQRWCLWLGECPPEALRVMPHAHERVEAVRAFRTASKSAPTRALAKTPTHFHVENMPKRRFLVIPKVSSERRAYIPIDFVAPRTLVSDLCFILPDTSLFTFAILTSQMHMAWVRSVCGRLKSDYRYSAGIVYNNFPWPDAPTAEQRAKVEAAAQAVLDARAQFPTSTLADLYDPVAMPAPLAKAHAALDRAVDRSYQRAPFPHDRARVEHLFLLYERLTAPLVPATKPRRARRAQ